MKKITESIWIMQTGQIPNEIFAEVNLCPTRHPRSPGYPRPFWPGDKNSPFPFDSCGGEANAPVSRSALTTMDLTGGSFYRGPPNIWRFPPMERAQWGCRIGGPRPSGKAGFRRVQSSLVAPPPAKYFDFSKPFSSDRCPRLCWKGMRRSESHGFLGLFGLSPTAV